MACHRQGLAFCLALLAGARAGDGLADSPPATGLAFRAGSKGEYVFDTGSLSGVLRHGGGSGGLKPVTDTATRAPIAGRFGLFSIYRILTGETRYGNAAWEWPSTGGLRPDGSVGVEWPAQDDRPLVLRATYRWSGADTLDMEVDVRAMAALSALEVFLASYFSGFAGSWVYVKEVPGTAAVPRFAPAEARFARAEPGFLEAKRSAGDWQAFPRDDAAVGLVQDGRWKRPPHPVTWTIMPRYAAPLAMRRDKATGLTAVIMAPPEDCFAVLTPYGEEGHRSLYLSLFGRDLKPGETARARARLVVRRGLADQDAITIYETYLKEGKP
jgi:hypothetical protein